MENAIVRREYTTAQRVNAQETGPSLGCDDLGPGKVAIVEEAVNNGTQTLHIEWSPDGTDWFQLGADLTDASTFPLVRDMVDGSGNDLPAKFVRLRCSAHTGTGAYDFSVAGRQLKGFA